MGVFFLKLRLRERFPIHFSALDGSIIMGAVLVANKDGDSRTQQGPKQKRNKQKRNKRKKLGQDQLSIQQWSDVCRGMKMSLREQQVCKLLFDGLTRQKIAEHLDISNRTVRHHMEQIHVKLNVCNRVGVVLRIIQLRDRLSSAPLISSQVRAAIPSEETPAEVDRTPPSEA